MDVWFARLLLPQVYGRLNLDYTGIANDREQDLIRTTVATAIYLTRSLLVYPLRLSDPVLMEQIPHTDDCTTCKMAGTRCQYIQLSTRVVWGPVDAVEDLPYGEGK